MIKGLFVLSMVPFCALANWQGHFAFDLAYDHLSGYSQTPKGGNFGTSSTQRPSFSEVNDTHDAFYRIEGGVGYHCYFLDLTYSHLNPHGSTLLTEPLLTHAQLIPQNSPFHMDTNFDLANVKVGKAFLIQNWGISPFVSGEWLSYRYQFNAPSNSSERSFSAFAPSFGLKIKRKIGKNLTAEMTGATTFNLTNLNVYSGEVGLAYALYQNRYFEVSTTAKMGLFEIDFKDNQPFPNHVRYTASPYGSLGLLFSF